MSFSFDLHSAAVSNSHLPCHSSQGHGTACPSRQDPWANCPHSAISGYHVELHEDIRHIPMSDADGQCETKHRLAWTRKRVVAAHYKKRRSVTLLDVSFPFDLHSAAVSDSHLPCHAHAML